MQQRLCLSARLLLVGAIFVFFNTLQSHPAVVFNVYLLPKSTILNARARNPNRFVSALAVETLLPASGNRSNYSHDFSLTRLVVVDTYHIYGMQQFLYWRVQVLLLYGGHQKVIDVVGGGTELLLNNRPAESGALRLEIVSLDLCRVL
jgi:hypothetical protein